MSEKWRVIERKKEHPVAKNKHLTALLLTSENAVEISDQTDAFTVTNINEPKVILSGPLSLQKLPVWIINLNPKSKQNNYCFESDRLFDRYFTLGAEVD